MANKKKYWTGPEELNQSEEFLKAQHNEFPEEVTVDKFLGDSSLSKTTTNRRDFLKFLGFSITAATVAACETPVIKSIPYVNKPEEITPGVPVYYASSYFHGNEFAGIIVKTREGRPIHIKGNKKHSVNKGAISAKVNSSVLGLYDSARLKTPLAHGAESTWPQVDAHITKELKAIANKGGNITILSGTIISPSELKAIDSFSQAYGGNVKVVYYDAISRSAIREANRLDFGRAFIPFYDFSKAKTIVSLSADFLGDWLMSNRYSVDYTANRNPHADWINKHYHIEAIHSLTGSNADVRIPIKPSQEGAVAVALYNAVAQLSGQAKLPAMDIEGVDADMLDKAANDLMATKGASLVVSGSNDPAVQQTVNALNALLGSYGNTIRTDKETFIAKGDDREVMQLVKDMNSGRVNGLLINNCNPVYSLPNAADFLSGLEKVSTTICFSMWNDETASRCNYVCPENHYLESWNDFYPVTGHYALAQPVIRPLYDTRQFAENLLTWSEGNAAGYMEFVKSNWRDSLFADTILFDDFWFNAVRNGSVNVENPDAGAAALTYSGNVSAAANSIAKAKATEGYEVVFYTKTAIGDGYWAANPWLQELPDPITKVTWDNYITMNPAEVKEKGFNLHIGQESYASLATVSINGQEVTLPVFPTPGQKRGTIGIALGYGRGANSEPIGRSAYRTKEYGGYENDEEGNLVPIGKNLFPFLPVNNGFISYMQTGAKVEGTGDEYPLACTQISHTVMGRESILKETTFQTFKSAPREAYNPPHMIGLYEDGKHVEKGVEHADLWKHHPIKGVGHRWGMSIDLSSCIGCGACVTACHSENNVPVVGKDEVRRARDMHWLRIDRYFASDTTKEERAEMGVAERYKEQAIPEYDNPSTIYMPMLCQHCNHAPCETVCPVLATTHSDEGLNQMTYNRCIGTRYCANNCPYKVRRFNWFNYTAYDKFADINPAQDPISRMVLNPDVTVRSRGVMEKCSFCVQRIQEGKLEAKKRGEPVEDGAVVTACAEACGTGAIKFGDLNDEGSVVNKLQLDDRTYYALEEIGVKPNVSYMVKVRNT